MATKLNVYGLDGKAGSSKQLPKQFDEPVRTDLIKKAVLSIQSKNRQPYGAFDDAGDRHAVDVSRRRRDYKGSYGKGISRVPRKVLSRRGGNFNWVGARAPGTKGGRRAHPPKASKEWTRSMNIKENRKAIRSAIAATISAELVTKRGHKLPSHYPFILADAAEQLTKTKDVVLALEKLGFEAELTRSNVVKYKPGVGKSRGRSKKPVSILFVTGTADAKLHKAANAIPGVSSVAIQSINAEHLAPGTHAGRVTLFTESALKTMEEKKLFL